MHCLFGYTFLELEVEYVFMGGAKTIRVIGRVE
jgi:hypothetical protein